MFKTYQRSHVLSEESKCERLLENLGRNSVFYNHKKVQKHIRNSAILPSKDIMNSWNEFAISWSKETIFSNILYMKKKFLVLNMRKLNTKMVVLSYSVLILHLENIRLYT